MRVLLVCGGRTYGAQWLGYNISNPHWLEQQDVINQSLSWLWPRIDCDVMCHGDCPTGADREAHRWAVRRGIPVVSYPVGRGESPIARNERMWRRAEPVVVAAFPGGPGTQHMCSLVPTAGTTQLVYFPSQGERLLGI